MQISNDTIQRIKESNSIETVISPYVQLKRRGKNLIGLCPFHNEKTPSFTVYPESDSFYCYGCGKGGDIFTFTKLIENLDYVEAVKLLADRSGIHIEESQYDSSMQKLKKTVLEINRESAKFFHQHLMSESGKWALDYLTKRGLSINTIKHFGLGAAPESWDALKNHLKSKGFSEWEMQQADMVSKSERTGGYYDRYRKRVMFPIIDLRGNVIAFSGRAAPDTEGAKYINSSDTVVYKKSNNLFGINFAKNNCADRVILVEGNMDVVSLHQAGFTNTVAPLGTAFTVEQGKLLSRYTKEIAVVLDADDAGKKAVLRTLETMKNSGMPIRIVNLPECKDPDEYIKKNGAPRFQKLLDGAVSDIEYRLLLAAEGISITDTDAKIKYLNKAAEILASLDDLLAVDMYASQLAEKYGSTKTAILAKVKEIKSRNVKNEKQQIVKRVKSPQIANKHINNERARNLLAANAEETIIAILLQHPDNFEYVYNALKPEDMITSLNRRIYEEFCNQYSQGYPLDISVLGDRFSNEEMGYLVLLQNSVKGEENAKDVLKDCISVILKQGVFTDFKSGESLSTDEWQDSIKKMIDMKKGE